MAEEQRTRDFYVENIYWTALYVLAKYHNQAFDLTIKKKRPMNPKRIMKIENFYGNYHLFQNHLNELVDVQKTSNNVADIQNPIANILIGMLRTAGWIVSQIRYVPTRDDFCYVSEIRIESVKISKEEMARIADVFGPRVYEMVLATEDSGTFGTVAFNSELIASVERPMLEQLEPEMIPTKRLDPCYTTMELVYEEEETGFTQESWQFVYPDY